MPRQWRKRTERQCVQEGTLCLRQFAKNIEPEYVLEGTGFRVDLKGELPNGEFVLLECKGFDTNLTPYAEALVQAASYADAIEYPVFIGPVRGDLTEIISGRLDNALGMLHAIASRMNVGLLYSNRYGNAGLILRGRRLADAAGVKPEFASVWYHSRRNGSKWVRS